MSGVSQPTIRIGHRKIGAGFPAYFIAEISANHHHRYQEAATLIRAAKSAGADAVKFQTYTADTITLDCDKKDFRIRGGTLWDGRTLYDLYKSAYTPWEWQPKLKKLADRLGIEFFSSAFDPTAVDFLETLGVPVHKVASFEIVDIPLIEKMARTGKPMILSTGLSNEREINEAITAARKHGATQLALLKCSSAYPAPPESMNLKAISYLAARFRLPIGLSDHTTGTEIAVAAVSLGACLVEKHLTLSRRAGGPDSAFSLEPAEFKRMIDSVRVVEKALGGDRLGSSRAETKSRMFRRSLYAVRDIAAGDCLTPDNVRSIRPAFGLAPKHAGKVWGRRAAKRVSRGTPLGWDLIR